MWSNASDSVFARSASFDHEADDEEEALRWAALERLPTYARVRRGIFRNVIGELSEVDVGHLHLGDQRLLLDRLVAAVDNDVEAFFDRMRRRFDALVLLSSSLRFSL